ncbi:MAG: CRISPR-associated endonuclease Cas1 [Anaerolineae bacterium]|jgi:CRISPR-associated protein Cas1|nr:CRISPR-associated endonuclease Cas1 [Anaerolineae bacterium]
MSTLYLIEPGARLEKEYQRLIIVKDGEVLQRIPTSMVSQVVMIGSTGVTAPALLHLLQNDVGLSLISPTGKLLGRLAPVHAPNLALRHQQYDRTRDPAACYDFSRQVVRAKLHNQSALACRLVRNHREIEPAPLVILRAALLESKRATSIDQLRGLEGAGARAYFEIFRNALGSQFSFEKRQRRPPTDPINALLSLGYSLLTQNAFTALEIVGLDPYDGFFHADRYNRPALALDLMEEFRPVIVDALIVDLVNHNRVGLTDFTWRGKACYLSEKALKKFLTAYTTRLRTAVRLPGGDRRTNYLQCMEHQARQIRKWIEGEVDRYVPHHTR